MAAQGASSPDKLQRSSGRGLLAADASRGGNLVGVDAKKVFDLEGVQLLKGQRKRGPLGHFATQPKSTSPLSRMAVVEVNLFRGVSPDGGVINEQASFVL